jgi:hypothetical protein
VLRHKLDLLPIQNVCEVSDAPLEHENVRGRDYYVN